MANFCGNCAAPLEDRPQCVQCGMFAPATRVTPVAPPQQRATPADRPGADEGAGDTRARVRLYGIRSEMAAAKAAQEMAERLGTTQKRAPLNSVVPGAPSPVRPRSNHELDGAPAEHRPAARAPRGPRPLLVPSQPQSSQPQPWPAQPGHPYPGQFAAGTVPPPVQFGPPAPPVRAPRPVPLDNPFARLAGVDAAKDAGALLCLVLALFLPWGAASVGGRLWWVVVPLAVSALGLVVPYVMTSRLFPAFRPAQSAAVKAAATVPLVLAAAASLVTALVVDGEGIGVGVAAALTGAALTVQPRRSEEVLGFVAEHRLANAAFVVALLAVVLHVVAFPFYALSVDAGGALGWFSALLLLLAPPLAVLGFPALWHAMGRTSGRRVFAVSGLTCLAVTVLAALDVPGLASPAVVERLGGPWGGAFLVGAAAALALAHPAVRRTGAGVDPALAWVQTARLAFALTGVTLVGEVLVLLAVLVFSDAQPGVVVGATVLRSVAALLAIVAAVLLVDPGRRIAAVGLGVGVVVLAAVGWALTAAAAPAGAGLGPWQAAAWFALPALGVWSLVVPQPVRVEARRRAVRRVPTSWQPPQTFQPAPAPGGYAPLAAVPPLGTPAQFRPDAQQMTYVQSPGTTQTRRIPTGHTPVPAPGQEWSGWRVPHAR